MKENNTNLSGVDNAPLQEICSFIEANVDEKNVAEDAEDIDVEPAPLPDRFKENKNEEAPLPLNVSNLKKVLDESRKTLSKIQKTLVEKLHDNDAKILQVDCNNNNSASVYLQFDEKCVDKAKITNAINQAIEHAKNNNQNFEIKQEYLPYIKSIFVDRKSVKEYSQGGGDDEVLLNGGFNDRKLTSLKFYRKHTKHPGAGEYNMIMVAEYEENNKNDENEEKNKNDEKQVRKQYCIIDMDNNLIISNDQLKLYWHNMDDFTNNGFDDEEHKVYESGVMWHAFRINNRLHNDKFKEAKKFILANGSKLYGIETLKEVTKQSIERECERFNECKMEREDECLTWAEALINKISAISDSINNATTIQQLYETFLQDIQKDLLKVNLKADNNDNNFLCVNGKDIVDFFSNDEEANKTINRSNFFKNNISTSDFKQKILDEIFQDNTGCMYKIDFVKAFLAIATQRIVDAINTKIKKLNNNVHREETNNGGKNNSGETKLPLNTKTKFEWKEDNVINNNTATTCGCFKGFSLCG